MRNRTTTGNRQWKIYIISICGSLLCMLMTWPLVAQNETVRRFGLFVGTNEGGNGRQTLRWAVNDATKLSSLMSEMGGILPADNTLLRNPGRDDILNSLKDIARLTTESSNKRVELLFYYSGHSDLSELLLGNEQLSYLELREAIHAVNADVHIAILDSCASGAFVRSKGGQRTQPFLFDDSVDMTGHALLPQVLQPNSPRNQTVLKHLFLLTIYLVPYVAARTVQAIRRSALMRPMNMPSMKLFP